jgi:hypothetical protein
MTWGIDPAWGIFTQDGESVLLADSVASVEYHNNWLISDYPQEQGAFTSYNKVKTPYDAKITFLTGSDYATRAGFLEDLEAATASLDLFVIVTPEISYPNANLTFFTYRRSARSGASLLRVEVWAKEIRLVQTGVLSNTQSPNGADKQINGAVQPQNTGVDGSPNLQSGLSPPTGSTPSTAATSSTGSTPSTTLQTTNVSPSHYDATNVPDIPNTYDELALPQQEGIIDFGQKSDASTAIASPPTDTGHSYVIFGGTGL